MVYDAGVGRSQSQALEFPAVSRQLTVAELTKAARNLKRIELYLVPRSDWEVAGGDVADFKALRTAADGLAFTIGQRALALGIDAKITSKTDVEPLPPEAFEGASLKGFGAFLRQLDGWFVSQGEARLEEGGGRLLGKLQQSLDSIRTVLIVIEENQEPAPAPASAQPSETVALKGRTEADQPNPPETSTPPQTPRPPVRPVTSASDDIYEGTRSSQSGIGGEAVDRTPPPQIAFVSSDADPLFTWTGSETVELTPLAKERIAELFESEGIEYFRYQMEKFAEEVEMRIATAPEGHVLVVKCRQTGDEIKPFLSYVPEKTLA
jgi:hypothetical protein